MYTYKNVLIDKSMKHISIPENGIVSLRMGDDDRMIGVSIVTKRDGILYADIKSHIDLSGYVPGIGYLDFVGNYAKLIDIGFYEGNEDPDIMPVGVCEITDIVIWHDGKHFYSQCNFVYMGNKSVIKKRLKPGEEMDQYGYSCALLSRVASFVRAHEKKRN